MTFKEKIEAASLEQLTFSLLPIALILAVLFIGAVIALNPNPRKPVVVDLRNCK